MLTFDMLSRDLSLISIYVFIQEVVQLGEEAQACIAAADKFYENNDFCVSYYRAFYNYPSFGAFETAATAVCTNQNCKSRIGDLVNYLRSCDNLRNIGVCNCVI